MKKGFTLVEIIISITLILIIGTGATIVFVSSNNKDKDINDITNKILEAADAYVRVQTDDNGNLLATEVASGAKGVKIPLTNLVTAGYISESDADKVYEYGEAEGIEKGESGDYYVAFLTTDLCDGSTVTLASWMDAGKDVYLCNDYKKVTEEVVINNIIEHNNEVRLKWEEDKVPVTYGRYKMIEDSHIAWISMDNFTFDENDIFTYHNQDTDIIYSFYRGAVKNNYLQLGTKNGKPLLWRIVWYSDDGRMKIALDDTIPVILKTSDGEEIEIEPGTKLYEFYDYLTITEGSGYRIAFIPEEDSEPTTTTSDDSYYNDYSYKIKYKFDNMINASSKTTYSLSVKKWLDSTNLKSFDFVIANGSCNKNYRSSISGHNAYYPSNVFECYKTNTYEQYTGDTTFEDDISIIGNLTYGDVYMSGLISNRTGMASVHSEHYLVSAIPYLLEELLYEYDIEDSSSLDVSRLVYTKRYFVDKNGLVKSNTIEEIKEVSNILYKEYRKYWCSKPYNRYTLYDESGTLLYENLENCGGDLIVETSDFFAQIKPTMILDISNKALSNSLGTKDAPFTIQDK